MVLGTSQSENIVSNPQFETVVDLHTPQLEPAQTKAIVDPIQLDTMQTPEVV